MMNPMQRTMAKVIIWSQVVCEKLPAAQLWNMRRLSESELNWRIEITALIIKPSITPKISKVPAPANFLDAAIMVMAVAAAPMNAAPAMDNVDVMPPVIPHKVAMAAPRLDPALTPMICGSASGLRNMLCICKPARASDAPARIEVMQRGIRRNQMMRASASDIPAVMESTDVMRRISMDAAMKYCLRLYDMLQN